MVTGTAAVGTENTPLRRSENRRSNKPIMEKRRRARINNCLNELKSLLLDALKKDPARHSKLEKADILEMTVKHVETLQRHQAALTAATDPAVVNKFKAGWSECVTEVSRFPDIEAAVKRRLVEHLSTCLDVDNGSGSSRVSSVSPPPAGAIASIGGVVQQQMLISRSTSAASVQSPSPATITATITAVTAASQFPSSQLIQRRESNTTAGVLALVPTRLSNGDIALVLPAPPPLVPASSHQQPLCLAISKQNVEKPWRPW